MKVRITVDIEIANHALAALAIQAASIARIAKVEPDPKAFNWSAQLKTANDVVAEFRKAVGNAELVLLD